MIFDKPKKMWGNLDEETSKIFASRSGDEVTIYLDFGEEKKVPLDVYIYSLRYSGHGCHYYYGAFYDAGEWYNIDVVVFSDDRKGNIVFTPVMEAPMLSETGLQNYYSRKIKELEPCSDNLRNCP